ncbi:2490_t:CDS:1, partial [Acaulospora morrowiae]
CLEGADKITVRQINLDTRSLVSSRLLNKAKEMVVGNTYNNNDTDKLEKKHVISQKFLDLLKIL